jgi:hypothetical protein
MAKAMNTYRFGYTNQADSRFHGLLETIFMDMMPSDHFNSSRDI